MVHDSKVLARLQDPDQRLYLDCFIENVNDALELLRALQESLDSDDPNPRRCVAFLRAAVSFACGLEELQTMSVCLDRLMDEEN